MTARKISPFPFLAFIIVLLCLTFGIPPSSVCAEDPTPVPRFEPTDCRFEIPQGETIQCGYLVVPENRSLPDSPTIRISVTVVKSHSSTPAPDPIICLNGGPGGKSKDIIEKHLSRYDAWLAKRDLILFDQRGVGWSQPALDCPEVKETWLQQAMGANLTIEAQLAPRLACRDRWLNQGIDLTAYNSTETAADVVDLWQTLGYEQVNLYGISYGTIPAQLIMRDYGATGNIRSVILEAAVPIAAHATADTPAQVARSMVRLFEKCEADPLCQAAYPNLKTIYPQVIDRLKTSPVTLSAANPLNGEPFSFQFDAADFGFLIIYGHYRTFPGLIYDIHDGNYTAAVEAQEDLIRNINRRGGDSFGLRTSINCNEPWQTISPEQRTAMAVYPEAAFMDNPMDTALCEQWPSFPPTDQAPAVSDIPTLVLIGEHDTRLFPYGEMIAESLSHGYYFLVPGASHSVLASGGACPNLIVLSFFDNPTQPPDSDCLASAGPPRFDTQFIIRAAAIRSPVRGMLGLMSILVVGLVVGAGIKIRKHRASGLRLGFAWRSSLRIVGWLPLVVGVALVWLMFYASQTNLLPFFRHTDAIALILPIIVAIQAALLFSPENEPALEVMLATPRPPAWTLLERLTMLFILQGSVATVASLYLSHVTGESLAITISRWLPLIFLLSGVAVYMTLATRRAIFGVLVVCLLWIVLTLFGNYLVDRWPTAWPFHLYLQPNQAEYILNRLFITLLGVSLIGIAAVHLLGAPERLLLGRQKARQRPRVNVGVKATEAATVKVADTGPRPRTIVLTQLAAMIRYEFLLQWRRVALPALVVGLIITPVLGAFIAQENFRGYRAALATGTLSLEVAKAEITAEMMPMMWVGISLIVVMMIPLAVADTVPKDQQTGVRELLDTLPLSPGTYLAGKLLSLWLSLLVSIGLAAFIAGAVWRLMVGPFQMDIFLDLWFVGAVLLALINAGTSMLLGAGQPTNRRAILVGGAYVLICLAGMGFVFSTAAGWWRFFNPARPAVMLYYALGYPDAVKGNDDLIRAAFEFVQQVASREDVLRSLGAGLVQVGVVWLIVWLWLKRRKM